MAAPSASPLRTALSRLNVRGVVFHSSVLNSVLSSSNTHNSSSHSSPGGGGASGSPGRSGGSAGDIVSALEALNKSGLVPVVLAPEDASAVGASALEALSLPKTVKVLTSCLPQAAEAVSGVPVSQLVQVVSASHAAQAQALGILPVWVGEAQPAEEAKAETAAAAAVAAPVTGTAVVAAGATKLLDQPSLVTSSVPQFVQGCLLSTTRAFGPYVIRDSEVFFETPWSLCLVNLKPVVKGHVLVIPRRVVPRFAQLSAVEVSDLWLTAQRVGSVLEKYHHADALTFATQDGRAAGQTVPHVHVHILPRHLGDFENNDDVYDAIDASDQRRSKAMDMPEERRPRSLEDMAKEAAEYRVLFE